jgi:SPP1 family predicted phage head-tail adaptor
VSSWAARAKPVTIERRIDTSDNQGGKVRQWVPFVQTRASIDSLSGEEQLQAGQLEARMTHKLRIRYWSAMTVNTGVQMRVRYGARVFSVTSITNEEEANVWLDLMCHEDVGIVAAT